MEVHVLSAALAGLLHDIGKFSQRAGVRPSRMWDDEARSEYHYEHALLSGDFMERYLPASLKPLSPPAYHHSPRTDFDRLVQLADRLSAGEGGDSVDRAREPRRLLSIFSRVRLKPGTQAAKCYLPLVPLMLDKSAMVASELTASDDVAGAYQALWNGETFGAKWAGFSKDAERLSAGEGVAEREAYLESLLSLMQRYTACIPSTAPDVSLYDHSRSVAAIAACLAGQPPDQIRRWLSGGDRDKHVALLVGGDISGVQSFLYTLTSKRAAKTLRGRSFYLQLLTEAVLRFVLGELGMPYSNVIYSGGGHFYLLAPTESARALPGIQSRVTEKLLRHHGTALYLAMGWAPVPAAGFGSGEFHTHWGRMHSALTRAKLQRYNELGDDLYERIFRPLTHGGNQEKTCRVCGEERDDTEGEADSAVCGLCRSFEQLGHELAGAGFAALGLRAPEDRRRGDLHGVLQEFGVEVALVKGAGESVRWAHPPERAVLWALDDPPGGQWPHPARGTPASHALRYTVNRVPAMRTAEEVLDRNERIGAKAGDDDYASLHQRKSFSHLEAESIGIPRLGVLRMDVDNLGDIFRRGLVAERGGSEENLATLARVSALSFRLSLFFEGWVKRLCEQENYVNKVYPVYSGGDDLFLIGPWNLMPRLAQRIADDFAEYVGHNPDVHLSGGMAFIHGKYPVYQAADDAKDSLDMAKDQPDKNAFAFLGQAWSWNDFGEVAKMQDRLVDLVRPKNEGGLGGTRAILHALQTLAGEEAEQARSRGRPLWGAWMWRAAYQVVRWEHQAGKETELGKALHGVHQDLSRDGYRSLAWWGAAARWAQLLIRERSDGR